MKYVPHPYQREAIKQIVGSKSCGLFLDMGLGKTVITLTAITSLLATEEIHKVLVIAPLQTARNTWIDERDKWNHTQSLRISLVLGTDAQRRAALAADADIYVINRENVVWLCEALNRPKAWTFDMVVIDELSSFKNPAAKRFRALRKVLPMVHKVVGLTGTPAPNGYMDLWSEVYLLDRGERLFPTVTMYRNTYFDPGRRNAQIIYEWKLKKGAKEIIDRKLSDLCVSMKAEDYLAMPDKVTINTWVSMDEKEKGLYDRFAKDNILPEKDIVGLSAAAVQNKLLQMANGFVYDEAKAAHHLHDKKIEALAELKEAANRPLLVMYRYVADRDRLLEAFPDAVVLEDRRQIEAWNRGEIQMLITHPASAGHGLNLQAGGETIVWFGLPWSLELYQQANARLYRQGQKKTVYVYRILTKDTHDEDVAKAIESKNITQEELLRALKARIAEWRKQ